MTGGSDQPTELDKIRLEKELDAAEAVRVHEREVEKLRQTHAQSEEAATAAADREISNLGAANRLAEAVADAAAVRAAKAARDAAGVELRKAQWDAEHALHKAYHDNVAEVAKGAIDRARKGAEFLEKAALGIVGIYTGLLGLVFSVTDRPLPRRGVYPAIFLGLAIAGAAAYLAFLRRSDTVPGRKPGSTLRATQENRTFFLADWITAGVFNKRYALRLGVLALMAGVAFLPAPFLAEPSAVANGTIELEDLEPPIPDERISDPTQRAARFDVDLRVYEEAAMSAIASGAPQGILEPSDQPNDAERNWFIAFIVALLVCLVSPWLYGVVRNDQ